MSLPVSYEDICHARERLVGKAVFTPLMRFPVLDEWAGGTIFIKVEAFQRTGSFKFRGAYNAISQLPEDIRAAGVVACSSGNHAQGVAEAARLFGIAATIVMPQDAPTIKIERTKGFGADVILYDREKEDREAIAREVCEKTGASMIHPFNDPKVIAGQGTIGLEIAAQMKMSNMAPDQLLVGASGGGVASGTALAIASEFPGTTIHTVEPAGFDDYARTLATGMVQKNQKLGGSLCDALLAQSPGENGLAIMSDLQARGRLGQGLVVSDEEAMRAVAYAFRELKLVLEPGGAVGLAAVLSGHLEVKDKVTCVVATGGNIDGKTMADALSL